MAQLTRPTLPVSKTGSPNPVEVGANPTYTVTITNTGTGNLSAVTITDPLPAGVRFVAATPSQGACSPLLPVGGSGTVSCELGGVSTSPTLTLVVQPTAAAAGTTITNTAVVATNNAGSATATATATTTSPTGLGFAPAANFGAGVTPYAVAAADVNGDGRPDLLVANLGSNSVAVLLNQTAPGATRPSFAPDANFPVGSSPQAVAAADVNGDGCPDLLTANYGDSTGSVLLNSCRTLGLPPRRLPRCLLRPPRARPPP